MDQQSETEMSQAELRERDERTPEPGVAEAPAEDRAEPDDDQAAPEGEAPAPKKKRSLLFVGLLIAAGAIAGGA